MVKENKIELDDNELEKIAGGASNNLKQVNKGDIYH